MIKIKKSNQTPIVLGVAFLVDIGIIAFLGSIKIMIWQFLAIFVVGGLTGEIVGSCLHRWLTWLTKK